MASKGDDRSFRVRLSQRSQTVAGAAAMHGENPMQHGFIGSNILRIPHYNKVLYLLLRG